LPEAELDRFLVSISLGYPTPSEERGLISRIGLEHPIEQVGPVTDADLWLGLSREAASTHLDGGLTEYLVAVVGATRSHPALDLGASTRATLALAAATRALATVRGRDYAIPDDVKELAGPVLAHRIVLSPEGRLRGLKPLTVIAGILASVPTGAQP
jgi:MoxR-like ATPase